MKKDYSYKPEREIDIHGLGWLIQAFQAVKPAHFIALLPILPSTAGASFDAKPGNISQAGDSMHTSLFPLYRKRGRKRKGASSKPAPVLHAEDLCIE